MTIIFMTDRVVAAVSGFLANANTKPEPEKHSEKSVPGQAPR